MRNIRTKNNKSLPILLIATSSKKIKSCHVYLYDFLDISIENVFLKNIYILELECFYFK